MLRFREEESSGTETIADKFDYQARIQARHVQEHAGARLPHLMTVEPWTVVTGLGVTPPRYIVYIDYLALGC